MTLFCNLFIERPSYIHKTKVDATDLSASTYDDWQTDTDTDTVRRL